jgi:O-antigen/teichoic acid export membrane protein
MTQDRNGVYPIVRNTGATVVIRGVFGLARVFLMLLIARRFGPDDFGRLSLALSVMEVFRVVADAGVDTVTIRRFSAGPRHASELLNNTLSLKVLAATAGYVLANLVFWLVYRDRGGLELLLIVAASLYTTLVANAFVSFFQARLEMPRIILSSLTSAIFYVAATIFGINQGWPLVVLAAVIPASELVNLCLVARAYGKRSAVHPHLDARVIKDLLKEGLPVGIAGIIVVAYSRMDNLMLGWFLGDRAVGEYAAAYRMTEPFLLVFSSLSISLFAFLAGAGTTGDAAKVKQTVFRTMAPLLGLSLGAALLLFLVSSNLIGWLSPDYQPSARVLQILCWSIVFKAINGQTTAFMNSRGKYSIIAVIALFNLGVNVFLNLLLIPRLGIAGAAAGVTATEALNTVVQVGCVLFLTGWTPGRLGEQWNPMARRP